MKKINYLEMQKMFENKEVVLSGGDGKAPMIRYEYAILNDGERNSVEVTFHNGDNKEIHCAWGELATFNDFIASEIGFYEKNGLSVEFFSRGSISNRNIIAAFNVKSINKEDRIDKTTEAESTYLDDVLEKLTDNEKDNTVFVNNRVAKLYYDMII